MMLKQSLLFGDIQDDSSQGLQKVNIINYPHPQTILNQSLKKTSKQTEKTFSKQDCYRVIQRELQKLCDYDYDITYQIDLFKFDRANPNHRIFQKYLSISNKCLCGHKWVYPYQKVMICFQLVQVIIPEQTVKFQQQSQLQIKNQYKSFAGQIKQQLIQILKQTLFPYTLNYFIVIDDKQCAQCKKMNEGSLYKNQIFAISKLFCRKIAQILSKQNTQQKTQKKELFTKFSMQN